MSDNDTGLVYVLTVLAGISVLTGHWIVACMFGAAAMIVYGDGRKW